MDCQLLLLGSDGPVGRNVIHNWAHIRGLAWSLIKRQHGVNPRHLSGQAGPEPCAESAFLRRGAIEQERQQWHALVQTQTARRRLSQASHAVAHPSAVARSTPVSSAIRANRSRSVLRCTGIANAVALRSKSCSIRDVERPRQLGAEGPVHPALNAPRQTGRAQQQQVGEQLLGVLYAAAAAHQRRLDH